jgi:hypothetical protein
MKKSPTDRNNPTDAETLLKDFINKLNEAKQSIAAGDKGITREQLHRRSQARLKRARRK